ncbi:MAG: hypothetical protein AB7I37_12270 [Pirellulales bacterium]
MSKVIRRNIRPRLPIAYVSEIDGWDDPAIDIGVGEDGDQIDSEAIISLNKSLPIPNATDSWIGSAAEAQLARFIRSGTWVPAWIAKVAGHPARAFVLSWLLERFGDSLTKDEDGISLPRARAQDDDGRLWWIATRQEIANATLLDFYSADRARRTLQRRELIDVEKRPNRLALRPNGRELSNAFVKLTKETSVVEHLKYNQANFEWVGSVACARSKDSIGTWVHDAIMVICDRKPGPALLLSHVLYWHSLSRDKRSRARITRNNKLWIARSRRELADNPGGDQTALSKAVECLAKKGFVEAENDRWCYKRYRDRKQPTLHLRPCPAQIGVALSAHHNEIILAISEKRNWCTPDCH